jgi:hypothetical protein
VGGKVAVATAIPSVGWDGGQCAWNSPTSSPIVRVGTAASIKAFGDPAALGAKALRTTWPGIGDGAVLT